MLLFGLALLLTACLSGREQEPPHTTPPTVVTTEPADGATTVATSQRISVTFSEAMDREATQAAFGLEPAVGCNFSWNSTSTTLSCQPATPLASGTTYTVTISAAARDTSGNTLRDTVSFSFITAPTQDNTAPPTVVSTSPADGTSDVAINTSVSVTFSEAMDQPATQAAFSTNPAVSCAFSWNLRGTTLTCRPTSNLSANTPYTVTISSDARDLSGDPLNSSYSFTFTTGTNLLQACVFGESTFGNCLFEP